MPRPTRRNSRPTRADTQISPKLAALHRVLLRQVRDVHILVLGDSTGDGADRWPRRLCNLIAAQYPTWTVVWAPWEDSSKSYPAGNRVTVQTGTSGRTLTLWNGSVSGQTIGYAQNFSAQLLSPIGANPDLILFNYGHNSPQLADNYRGVAQTAINLWTNTADKAMIAVICQNPRDPAMWPTTGPDTGTTVTGDQTKQHANYEMATSNGYLPIDVNGRFLDNPTYAADWLNSDGLHPNSAGSQFWAEVVWEALAPGRAVSTATAINGSVSRIVVPATDFRAGEDGAPTQVALGGVPTWLLRDSNTDSIVAIVDWPSHWRTVTIYISFVTATAVTGNVRFEVFHKYLGGRNGFAQSAGGVLGSWVSDGQSTQAAQGTAGTTSIKTLWDRTGLGGLPMALKVSRIGADAADTLASDINVLGLQVERAY